MSQSRYNKVNIGGQKLSSTGAKPIAKKTGSSLSDMNSFIDKEFKNLSKMNKNNLPKSPIKPESGKAKNHLMESMKNTNLNDLKRENPDDQSNASANKFEGFSKATKFVESSSTKPVSQIVERDVNASFSSSKIAAVKPDPFVIKFPENSKPVNDKAQSIINSLNKSDSRKAMPNMDIQTKDISPAKIRDKNEIYSLPTGKIYQPEIKKIDDSEDYADEYDDFVKEDELAKIEEEKRLENKKAKEIKIQPVVRSVANSKRQEIFNRVNDLRNVINYDSEVMVLFQFDCIKETNDPKNQKKRGRQEIGINTEPIKTKDNYTETDNGKEFIQTANKSNSKLKENKKKTEEKSPVQQIEITKANVQSNYQPLTYEAYKFFIHIGPFVENILLNNTNKYILQAKNTDQAESTGLTKLDREFIFPKDLIGYLFPNKNQADIKFCFSSFLFFDTKPYQIGFGVNLSLSNASPLNALLQDVNNSCNLIVIYCLFSNQIKKIYYSFAKINEMSLLGESENILVTGKADGTFDIFDLRNTDKEIYYRNYENSDMNSITRAESSIKEVTSNPKFELILPELSSMNQSFAFNSSVISIKKNVIESLSTEKLFRLFAIDQQGSLVIFNIRESTINSKRDIDKLLIRPDNLLDLTRELKRIFNRDDTIQLMCIDLKYYNEEKGNDSLYLLSNIGLTKITIEGTDNFIAEPIYNSSINKMKCFDIADTGNICAGFADYTVKVFDKNNDTIFTTFVSQLLPGAILEKMTWSNVICKNSKGKLIRKTLLANFYMFTSKNEFIIYDMNQKNAADLKKIKRKKDIGTKNNLTRKNSQLAISESLFTDYSNFILQTNCIDQKVEIYKLSLRKQYYEEASVLKSNDKICDKMAKAN